MLSKQQMFHSGGGVGGWGTIAGENDPDRRLLFRIHLFEMPENAELVGRFARINMIPKRTTNEKWKMHGKTQLPHLDFTKSENAWERLVC